MYVSSMQDKELKNRVRAFTGTFIVMISPVLLAIVLKKVNLTGAGKYEGGIWMLEVLVGLVQTRFPHLAAVTLLMGIVPFLCVMVSEACDILPPLSYVAPRLKALTKVLVFVANVSLMILGCGILLLFHKNPLLVVTFCSTMLIGVMVVNIVVVVIGYCSCDRGTEDDTAGNHSELEHLLEFSAGITVMMFLVLEGVVLEGLLRNSQGQAVFLGAAAQPRSAPTPSAAQGQETFLGGTLLISFVTTAFGVSLMNVWTVFGTAPRPWTPPSELEPEPEARAATESVREMGSASASSSKHAEAPMAEPPQPKRHQTSPKSKSKTVTLTATLPWCLNFVLHAVPVAAVLVLITLEVLPHAFKPAVWLPFFSPAIVLLVLLARCSCEEDSSNSKEDQGQAGRGGQVEIQMAPPAEQIGSSSGSVPSDPGKAAQLPEDKGKESDDEKQPTDKPASMELTKVAFTGFLAVAVPSVTNAFVGIPSIVFVLSTSATVLMGLLWRLLTTHEAKAEPPSYVLKAANHASFFAHLFILFAGVAFWVMAVNV